MTYHIYFTGGLVGNKEIRYVGLRWGLYSSLQTASKSRDLQNPFPFDSSCVNVDSPLLS